MLERRQVPLYLAAIALGALLGLLLPSLAEPAAIALTPVLGLLLFVTFLAVPFRQLAGALRRGRFLGVVLLLNFVLIPLLVFPLSRIVSGDPGVLAGVLLVLLTPCVDYVVAFTRAARGDAAALLALTPVLMLLQLALLPLYLWLFAGPSLLAVVEPWPFVEAFLLLIALPLTAAALVQWWAARFSRPAVVERLGAVMVPLMMLVLAVAVTAQIGTVAEAGILLLPAVAVFVLFAVFAVGLGVAAGRLGRLHIAERRAVIFSGVTRNSLVVLPLALALPDSLGLAGVVVVTQTLVELLVMVVLVALVPRLLPEPQNSVG